MILVPDREAIAELARRAQTSDDATEAEPAEVVVAEKETAADSGAAEAAEVENSG